MIHADYSESGSIVIEKGPDYFKFSNPGNLRVPLDIVMDGGRSNPRNTILHQMFSYLGFGERAGSGLYMINLAWKKKKWIQPKIKEELNPNRTTLILYMKKKSNNCNNNDLLVLREDAEEYYCCDSINVTQSKIIEIIKNNPSIKADEISNKLKDITTEGVQWHIKILKENGKI